MSAAIVRRALEIVDPSLKTLTKQEKKSKKAKGVFKLVPENHKIIHKTAKKAGKVEKNNLLSIKTKLTVTEARKNYKTKHQILHENLRKLKEIKKACTVELDKETTKNIIERAVTKRPIKRKPVRKQVQKTAFTEEDFRKFEAEYFDE